MYWIGDREKHLSAEKQLELIRAYKSESSESAKALLRNEIVKANYGTILNIAQSYSKAYSVFSEDMFNEGVLGACKALDKYDPKFENSFTTYATYWINLFVITFIKHNSKSVTITEYANYKLQKMNREGTVPNNPNFKTRKITELYAEDETLDPATHKDDKIDIDGGLLKSNRSDLIDNILKTFPVREKVVIRCRYNLNNCKRKNLHEIGAFFDVTSECVRQIERRALKRLRARFVKLGITKRKDFADD